MPSPDFQAAVARLHHPRMGTELVGPLLYSLVRSTRPQHVLEVGSGATSLYLLQALADNTSDIQREVSQLTEKQPAYDPRWNREGAAADHRSEILAWMLRQPYLARPEYYDSVSRPKLISVDKHSSPHSSAAGVDEAARALGLECYLHPRNCDFRDRTQVLRDGQVFDFVWFDCGGYQDYRDFVDLYWKSIEPENGLLLLHYTLTVPNHERILNELDAERASRGPFEMLSLLEPHKLMQNSVTLIRRCTRGAPRYPMTRPISLERDT